MPFFASDYFYITIIAIGHWIRPNLSVFKDLGFLVAFSTLITSMLKNILAFPRPDPSLRLIEVKDIYGFPSGDVLVAVIFWQVLCQHFQSRPLKLFATILVVLIFFSRIYLGVHTIGQVIGGLLLGFIIVYLWNLSKEFTQAWYQGKRTSFWVLLIMSGILCECLHYFVVNSQIGVMAIGSLIGYGLALRYMDGNPIAMKVTIKPILLIIIALFFLVLTAKYFPIFYGNELSFQISVMLKYAILVFSIYIVFPYGFGLFAKR